MAFGGSLFGGFLFGGATGYDPGVTSSGKYKAFLKSLYPDSHNVDGPVYDAVLGAFGYILDNLDPYQIGLVSEFSVTTATGDALDKQGADWGVPRRASESDDSYRARILAALAVYANGATIGGLTLAVQAFTGTAPTVVDCCTDGWIWTESAWGDSAWADPAGYFSVYIFVNNPTAAPYNHLDMETAIRRSLPARSRVRLWHNGADTSTLGEASDAHVDIPG